MPLDKQMVNKQRDPMRKLAKYRSGTPENLMNNEKSVFRLNLWIALLLFSLGSHYANAQEFPKGWVFPVELGQGFRALPLSDPLYLASLNFAPSYTLVEGRLRIGGNLGAFYTSRRLDGGVGPRLAYNFYDKGQVLIGALQSIAGCRSRYIPDGGFSTDAKNYLFHFGFHGCHFAGFPGLRFNRGCQSGGVPPGGSRLC